MLINGYAYSPCILRLPVLIVCWIWPVISGHGTAAKDITVTSLERRGVSHQRQVHCLLNSLCCPGYIEENTEVLHHWSFVSRILYLAMDSLLSKKFQLCGIRSHVMALSWIYQKFTKTKGVLLYKHRSFKLRSWISNYIHRLYGM